MPEFMLKFMPTQYDIKMQQKAIKLLQDGPLGDRGDNLYRAKRAFGNMSPAQLQEQYGQCGETCQEVLDGYQRSYDSVKVVIDWLEGIFDDNDEEDVG